MATITTSLKESGWSETTDGKAIEKSFRFSTFRDALAWMVRASFEIEAVNHHPEWSNVYNRIEVRLTTHDAGGLTEKDIDLAKVLDGLG
ncbi:MAG: 4a-hydroxytetrahydrobiopterin dehydratase [Pseudomonadota bacterium]